MKYVVGQDKVSAKPATLERKNIQSTKPIHIWQLSHAFDHTSGAVCAPSRRYFIVGKAITPADRNVKFKMGRIQSGIVEEQGGSLNIEQTWHFF